MSHSENAYCVCYPISNLVCLRKIKRNMSFASSHCFFTSFQLLRKLNSKEVFLLPQDRNCWNVCGMGSDPGEACSRPKIREFAGLELGVARAVGMRSIAVIGKITTVSGFGFVPILVHRSSRRVSRNRVFLLILI